MTVSMPGWQGRGGDARGLRATWPPHASLEPNQQARESKETGSREHKGTCASGGRGLRPVTVTRKVARDRLGQQRSPDYHKRTAGDRGHPDPHRVAGHGVAGTSLQLP